MSSDHIRAGDLVIVDPLIDKGTLYLHLQLQLRDSSDNRFYSSPTIHVSPGEMLLVLSVNEKDVMVMTSKGDMGWINRASLKVLSRHRGLT